MLPPHPPHPHVCVCMLVYTVKFQFCSGITSLKTLTTLKSEKSKFFGNVTFLVETESCVCGKGNKQLAFRQFISDPNALFSITVDYN